MVAEDQELEQGREALVNHCIMILSGMGSLTSKRSQFGALCPPGGGGRDGAGRGHRAPGGPRAGTRPGRGHNHALDPATPGLSGFTPREPLSWRDSKLRCQDGRARVSAPLVAVVADVQVVVQVQVEQVEVVVVEGRRSLLLPLLLWPAIKGRREEKRRREEQLPFLFCVAFLRLLLLLRQRRIPTKRKDQGRTKRTRDANKAIPCKNDTRPN